MIFESREDNDCYKCTVKEAHYMIHKCILFNPKNGLHFLVKQLNFDDDSCFLKCVETEQEHMAMLGWLNNWKVL